MVGIFVVITNRKYARMYSPQVSLMDPKKSYKESLRIATNSLRILGKTTAEN